MLSVPIEKSTNQQGQNPAGTLQIKITGIYDTKPDQQVETSPSFLDSSDSEEAEDRNSSKTLSHRSNDSKTFADNTASNDESMSDTKKSKNGISHLLLFYGNVFQRTVCGPKKSFNWPANFLRESKIFNI